MRPENTPLVLNSDSPLLVHAHYADESRQVIRAVARFSDGSVREMDSPVDAKDSAFLRDVYLQHSAEDLERNTRRETELRDARQLIEKRRAEDQRREEEREHLFRAKSEALTLGEVKNCPEGTALRVRKAKNATEVYALTAMAFMIARERAAQLMSL